MEYASQIVSRLNFTAALEPSVLSSIILMNLIDTSISLVQCRCYLWSVFMYLIKPLAIDSIDGLGFDNFGRNRRKANCSLQDTVELQFDRDLMDR